MTRSALQPGPATDHYHDTLGVDAAEVEAVDLDIAHDDGEPSGAPTGLPIYFDDESGQAYGYVDGAWLPFSSAGGGAAIVQYAGAPNDGGTTLVLPAAPTPGNLLIAAMSQRDGTDAAVVPTGFTLVAYQRNNTRSKSTTSWRAVQSGDTATFTYSIDSLGRWFIMEVSGVVAAAPTVVLAANSSGSPVSTSPLTCPSGGLVFAHASGDQAGLGNVASPFTELRRGDVTGGNSPTSCAIAHILNAAGSSDPSWDGGPFWGLTGGFWPNA